MTRSFSVRGFAMILLASACTPTAATEGTVAVAIVAVSPGTADLSLAGTTTAQLTAVTRDADGIELTGRAVAWLSTNTTVATVSNTGLVTALAAGTTTVSATSEGMIGSATITVVAGGGGGGGGGGSPTILIQEGFEDDNYVARGRYDGGTFTTSTTEHASGNRSLMGTFAAGAQNPSWFGGRWSFTPSSSIYLRFRVKYSANWVGSGGNSHPHEFFFMTNANGMSGGPAWTHLTTYVEHNYQNGGVPILAWQDGENIDQTRPNQNLVGVTEARSVAGCNGNADGIPSACYTVGATYWNGKVMRAAAPSFMPNAGPGYKGDWHTVEAYFQLNTIVGGIGQTNGIARYWFDGQLVLEATNAQFRTGTYPNMLFTQMLLSPYIGSGSPVQQTVWYDDIYLATARP